jgi:hypothetical protein
MRFHSVDCGMQSRMRIAGQFAAGHWPNFSLIQNVRVPGNGSCV